MGLCIYFVNINFKTPWGRGFSRSSVGAPSPGLFWSWWPCGLCSLAGTLIWWCLWANRYCQPNTMNLEYNWGLQEDTSKGRSVYYERLSSGGLSIPKIQVWGRWCPNQDITPTLPDHSLPHNSNLGERWWLFDANTAILISFWTSLIIA